MATKKYQIVIILLHHISKQPFTLDLYYAQK